MMDVVAADSSMLFLERGTTLDDKIITIPAVALRGMTILPGMVAHFDVSRGRSIRAIEEAMMEKQEIFLVTQRDVEDDDPQIEDLYHIGIIARIKQVIKMQNGIVRILVEGEQRAELSGIICWWKPFTWKKGMILIQMKPGRGYGALSRKPMCAMRH